MKPIFSLLLFGVVLLTACQSSKQSEGAAPNIDSLEQALAQSTDPLERIDLKRQILDLTMEAATPEERCRIFEEFATLVEEEEEYWQLLRDSENIAPDACLVLTWRELGDLIARYEAYAESNPEQKELFVRLSDNYQYLQMVYMTGTDNTPIANESGALDPELKSEWQRFMKAYPNSLTSELIKDFLQLKNYGDTLPLQERVERVQEASNHPLLSASSSL